MIYLSRSASLLALLSTARLATAQSVIAHYMAQQLYDYKEADITKDMQDAKAIGIEAFAMNIAAMDYEVDKIKMAYPIAEQLGFQLLYSFDTSYDWQAGDIVSLVAATANSSATYKWNGRPVISSFSPSGDPRGEDFWGGIKKALADQGVDAVLAPGLIKFRDPAKTQEFLDSFPSVEGFFNWWSWPEDKPGNLTTDTDLAYKAAVATRGGPYIMAVSPWQFKNINGEAWVESSDYIWKYRWEQAINEVKPDIIEIVTWNDYGESHYITDVNPVVNLGTDAPHYVTGVDHSAWQIPAKYYIKWFKSCGAAATRRARGFGKKRCGQNCDCSATLAPPASTPPAKPLPVPSSEPAPVPSSEEPAPSPTEAPLPEPTSAPVPSEPAPAPTPAPGSCAAPAIEEETIVYWYRQFPKDIECSGGGEVRNKDFVADEIFAYAMLKEPATIRIDAGASSGEFAVAAGTAIVSIPFPDTDETPFFQILRGEEVVKSGHGNMGIRHSGCDWGNFNPAVGSI
ncbi:hypothetical protein AURDEDRAFT_117617 [Auricularia subglabra TFB-10046 SS5]|uniref:Glycoside hydrolase n=1 Tax=Auricularia subglabra (strain TFB-10046 / SS5) TaxID=717982 RepID=J0WQ33_AURST|nr:hypothetical protein AURDEDRAFT_117617 [Auricularia subglabra TFB-10046 SS5]